MINYLKGAQVRYVIFPSAHQTGQERTGASSHLPAHFNAVGSPEHSERAGEFMPTTVPANFHGWWITRLPQIPLVTIANYLSVNDRNNLGKTCVKLRENLIASGIIERPTISPTSWLTVELDRVGYPLHPNECHNRLMQTYPIESVLRIWAPGEDGIWRREAAFPCRSEYLYHDDILFIPRGFYDEGGYLLLIFQRSDHGVWSETQRLNFNDLYNLPDSEIDTFPSLERITEITLSPDHRSLACRTAKNTVALLGLGIDGKWQHRGRFQYAHKEQFSHDGHHVALNLDGSIFFMSKNDDGLWVNNGEICLDSEPDKMEFSSDNRHFVTYFTDAGEDSDSASIELDLFFVIVAGLSQQGRWSEKMRINKLPEQQSQDFTLLTKFSPDGKHLVVGTSTDFEVWTLNDNKWVLSRQGAIEFSPNRGYGLLDDYSFVEFISNFEFILFGAEDASLWTQTPSGSWSSSLVFPCGDNTVPVTSPDGNTIFNQKRSASAELWSRRDGWEKLTIDYPVEHAHFNNDSSLLAMSCDNRLIIFRKSISGCWQEKCQLKIDGEIYRHSFSQCGRTINVHYRRGTRSFMTLWRIAQDND